MVIKACFIVAFILLMVLVILFYCNTPVTKNVQNYEYSLPFKKGARYRVVQGYGGLFSHRYIAAIDFEMPMYTDKREEIWWDCGNICGKVYRNIY